MTVDIPSEAHKAAPGIVGALVALQWVQGSPMQRLAAFVGGAGASFYGADALARWAQMSEGFAGFLVGLFGMAIAGKVFEAIKQLEVGAMTRRLLRKIGL